MITDKKITRRTMNRSHYYAPTDNGSPCFNLVKDGTDNPAIVPYEYDSSTETRMRTCLCSQVAPLCSYHLGETQQILISETPVIDPETGEQALEEWTGEPLFDRVYETQYLCARYEFMNHEDTVPTDTHEKKFKLVDNKFEWT